LGNASSAVASGTVQSEAGVLLGYALDAEAFDPARTLAGTLVHGSVPADLNDVVVLSHGQNPAGVEATQSLNDMQGKSHLLFRRQVTHSHLVASGL
jgi:hypothetical protein